MKNSSSKGTEPDKVRSNLLVKYSDAIDDEDWEVAMECYKQLVMLLEPNDIIMKLINMDINCVPIEFREMR